MPAWTYGAMPTNQVTFTLSTQSRTNRLRMPDSRDTRVNNDIVGAVPRVRTLSGPAVPASSSKPHRNNHTKCAQRQDYVPR